MQTTVQKWGNSLALRIPRHLAADLGLKLESPVDLRIHDGVLEVVPVQAQEETLAELLAHVTPENLHAESDTGASLGHEAW